MRRCVTFTYGERLGRILKKRRDGGMRKEERGAERERGSLSVTDRARKVETEVPSCRRIV